MADMAVACSDRRDRWWRQLLHPQRAAPRLETAEKQSPYLPAVRAGPEI